MASENHKEVPLEKPVAGSSPSDPTPPTGAAQPETSAQVSTPEDGVIETNPIVEAEVSLYYIERR